MQLTTLLDMRAMSQDARDNVGVWSRGGTMAEPGSSCEKGTPVRTPRL